jgi:HEPN domain-containing protein
VARLIKDLPGEAGGSLRHLLDAALLLDKLYIPTRYPDALAELTPSQAYTRAEALAAADHARTILTAAQNMLEDLRPK